MFTKMINILKENPRKIVFPEGSDPRILEASAKLLAEGILTPILVGDKAEIEAADEEYENDVEENVKILNLWQFDSLQINYYCYFCKPKI